MRTLLAIVLINATTALAQGIPLKGGASSDLANINTAKALETTQGKSTRATYTCTATGLATTALYSMQLDAEPSRGFKVKRICVSGSPATAAALVTVTVQRRSTASTGGTAATAEGTASPAVSKHDLSAANWGGRCAQTPTLGTADAVIDGWGWVVGEIGAGTADVTGLAPICRNYGVAGEQEPTVVAGTANGLSVSVGAAGAGGLASGAISITFVGE